MIMNLTNRAWWIQTQAFESILIKELSSSKSNLKQQNMIDHIVLEGWRTPGIQINTTNCLLMRLAHHPLIISSTTLSQNLCYALEFDSGTTNLVYID